MSEQNLSKITKEYFQARIKKKVRGKTRVIYNAYTIDSKGVPVNNIDEIAIQGSVRFFRPAEPFSTHYGKTYKSGIVTNPTWLQVAVLANSSIKKTKDYTNVVLDGVDVAPHQQAAYVFRLSRHFED